MTPAEVTQELIKAVEAHGFPPVGKSFDPPVALSAEIYIGGVQVR